MWRELNFTLSPEAESRLFGPAGRQERAFRKKLAAMDTRYGVGLPPAFFGYTPEGVPDPKGDTTIGMGYTANGLRLVATGSTACAMLDDRAGAINAALMHEAQALIPMYSRGGEHSANFLPFARPYFVQSLCLGKSDNDSFWSRAAKAVQEGSTWLQEADRKLPLTIGSHLMRQAVLLANEGDDCDGNVAQLLSTSIVDRRHWSETGNEFGKRLGVRMHAVGGHTYVKLGENYSRLVLKNVEFSMHVELGGPWFIGRLKIEGRGQVMPATGAWASQALAA